MEILRQALDAELIEKERYHELTAAAAERLQERLTDIEQREGRKRQSFVGAAMLAQVQTTIQGFQQIAAASDAGSRALFLTSRALAVASAIVSTKKAVAEALATPPVPNIGLAKITAALGYAQVAGILATTFAGRGGGGGAAAGGLGGGSLGPPAAPSPPPIHRPEIEREGRGQTVINVTINGSVNGPGGAEQLIDLVVDGLRERIDERDEIIISSTSRQAADLRT